jgi:hypothetical protein
MTDNVQTAYAYTPPKGLPGQIARNKPGAFSRTMRALASLTPGLVVFVGRAAGGEAGEVGPLTAPSASPTAFIASGGASSAAPQTLTTFNGALGPSGSELYPPRNVTLTLSSHADWNATTAVVTGTDENGSVITENLSIPDGGGATVTGSKTFRTVTQLVIPAQDGAGGTFTFGSGSELGPVDHLVEGVVRRDNTHRTVTFDAGELVAVVRDGNMFMTSETAVKEGDPVWVRVQVSGDEVLGAVRATPDGVTCARINGARFASTNAAGLSRVDFNLPSN